MEFTYFDSLRRALDLPTLRHAITTRHGGVSAAPFSSLNLGLHVGDEDAHVVENRQRVAQVLGFDKADAVWARQVHGADSHSVTPDDRGRGASTYADAVANADALICAYSSTPVWILVADCAPVLLVHPARQVLAVVHAGWRGAIGGIASRTLARMSSEFGVEAAEVRAGIGPCLCVNCLEVGEEVAREATTAGASTCVRRGGFDKPHLDLRGALLEDLARAGVAREHVEVLSECPRCDVGKYFSHRGEGGTAGRFGLVAWWA
jgi:YfiH family protein